MFYVYAVISLWLIVGTMAWYYEMFKSSRSSLEIGTFDIVMLPLFTVLGPLSWLTMYLSAGF